MVLLVGAAFSFLLIRDGGYVITLSKVLQLKLMLLALLYFGCSSDHDK